MSGKTEVYWGLPIIAAIASFAASSLCSASPFSPATTQTVTGENWEFPDGVTARSSYGAYGKIASGRPVRSNSEVSGTLPDGRPGDCISNSASYDECMVDSVPGVIQDIRLNTAWGSIDATAPDSSDTIGDLHFSSSPNFAFDWHVVERGGVLQCLREGLGTLGSYTASSPKPCFLDTSGYHTEEGNSFGMIPTSSLSPYRLSSSNWNLDSIKSRPLSRLAGGAATQANWSFSLLTGAGHMGRWTPWRHISSATTGTFASSWSWVATTLESHCESAVELTFTVNPSNGKMDCIDSSSKSSWSRVRNPNAGLLGIIYSSGPGAKSCGSSGGSSCYTYPQFYASDYVNFFGDYLDRLLKHISRFPTIIRGSDSHPFDRISLLNLNEEGGELPALSALGLFSPTEMTQYVNHLNSLSGTILGRTYSHTTRLGATLTQALRADQLLLTVDHRPSTSQLWDLAYARGLSVGSGGYFSAFRPQWLHRLENIAYDNVSEQLILMDTLPRRIGKAEVDITPFGSAIQEAESTNVVGLCKDDGHCENDANTAYRAFRLAALSAIAMGFDQVKVEQQAIPSLAACEQAIAERNAAGGSTSAYPFVFNKAAWDTSLFASRGTQISSSRACFFDLSTESGSGIYPAMDNQWNASQLLDWMSRSIGRPKSVSTALEGFCAPISYGGTSSRLTGPDPLATRYAPYHSVTAPGLEVIDESNSIELSIRGIGSYCRRVPSKLPPLPTMRPNLSGTPSRLIASSADHDLNGGLSLHAAGSIYEAVNTVSASDHRLYFDFDERLARFGKTTTDARVEVTYAIPAVGTYGVRATSIGIGYSIPGIPRDRVRTAAVPSSAVSGQIYTAQFDIKDMELKNVLGRTYDLIVTTPQSETQGLDILKVRLIPAKLDPGLTPQISPSRNTD